MKQTRYSIPLKILLLVLVLLLLSSCIIDDDFDEQEQALLDNYSSLFQERAVLQYGEHAKVFDIKAEIHSSNSILFPVFEYSVGSNLFGTIQVGDEQFEALYLTEQDEIYSKRNAEKIKQSAVQLFSDMGIEVIEMSLTDYFEKPLWLPDDVVDFKGLLDNNDGISSNVFVKGGLEDITSEDFMWLFAYDDTNYRCHIIFLQLNDLTEMETIRKKWRVHEVSFHAPDPKAYDDEREEYVDLFSYYNVESYMYVKKLSEKNWKFCYQNKDGIVVEKTIE